MKMKKMKFFTRCAVRLPLRVYENVSDVTTRENNKTSPPPDNITGTTSPDNITGTTSPGQHHRDNITGQHHRDNITGTTSPDNITGTTSPGQHHRTTSPGQHHRDNITGTTSPGHGTAAPLVFLCLEAAGEEILLGNPSSWGNFSKASFRLNSNIGNDVGNDVGNSVGNSVENSVENSVGNDVENHVGNDVGNDVDNDVVRGVLDVLQQYEENKFLSENESESSPDASTTSLQERNDDEESSPFGSQERPIIRLSDYPIIRSEGEPTADRELPQRSTTHLNIPCFPFH
ncbi:hypothetical protein EYF80_053045 [Liparis tanakae]|uniref:Uncharacterized protein n=1 Tax=Liparis tanakae TaxID=230148 RepID=A0A4Z2F7F3_9TELE|nr:hypothetical protein EYF80_053045 [Liparis tanakae]